MNRPEKRNYIKKLKQKGYSEQEIEILLKFQDSKNKTTLSENILEGIVILPVVSTVASKLILMPVDKSKPVNVTV
jgi:hypothetical protein